MVSTNVLLGHQIVELPLQTRLPGNLVAALLLESLVAIQVPESQLMQPWLAADNTVVD